MILIVERIMKPTQMKNPQNAYWPDPVGPCWSIWLPECIRIPIGQPENH